MKQIGILLLTIAAISAQAQNSQPEKPNLDILSFNVRPEIQTIVSKVSEPPEVYAPPQRTVEIEKTTPAEIGQTRSRPVDGPTPNPTRMISSSYIQRDLKFVYQVKARNTDQRTIKRLFWQYAPADLSMPVRRFGCEVSVKQNQVKEFKLSSPFAPSTVIDVSSNSKEFVDGQFSVTRIEYADGSVWQQEGPDLSGSRTRGSGEVSRKIQKNRCTWL